MTDSNYTLTIGLGLQTFLIDNTSVWMDYAYQNIDVLGGVNSFNKDIGAVISMQ